tara:strand:- start:2933 stop:3331 length:399 start_codon:yes stop_codon:yes gene_type:complete
MSYELKDYLNSINTGKNNLMDDGDELWEKKYPSYIVNKCLSPFTDTIMLVNEMNRNHHIDKKLQYDFLLNSLKTKKRFAPWLRSNQSKNLEYVKEYYGFSNEKAKSALNILNDEQIKHIKGVLDKGGKHGKR